LFVWLGFTLHQHKISHMTTFQLYWWRKTSGALPCIISGTNGHLSRTTDVLLASWIASSHERIQSPCLDSNPRRWGASGLKSMTLTTRPQTLKEVIGTDKAKGISNLTTTVFKVLNWEINWKKKMPQLCYKFMDIKFCNGE
jgi:hypothetical protein